MDDLKVELVGLGYSSNGSGTWVALHTTFDQLMRWKTHVRFQPHIVCIELSKCHICFVVSSANMLTDVGGDRVRSVEALTSGWELTRFSYRAYLAKLALFLSASYWYSSS